MNIYGVWTRHELTQGMCGRYSTMIYSSKTSARPVKNWKTDFFHLKIFVSYEKWTESETLHQRDYSSLPTSVSLWARHNGWFMNFVIYDICAFVGTYKINAFFIFLYWSGRADGRGLRWGVRGRWGREMWWAVVVGGLMYGHHLSNLDNLLSYWH